MNNIWILLIIFQFKHFIADYPLQTPYMLGKFKDKGWVLPLAAHCGIHFLFTFFISLICFFKTPLGLSFAIELGLLDFSIHFVMDRIKASPKLLGRFQALSKKEMITEILPNLNYAEEGSEPLYSAKFRLKSNTYFWYSLGLDQMVHHLTDILIIFLIVSYI